MSYRILERKGEFRVQQERRLFFLKWWSTASFLHTGGGYFADTFYSLDEAKKAIERLEARDEKLRTPWREIE